MRFHAMQVSPRRSWGMAFVGLAGWLALTGIIGPSARGADEPLPEKVEFNRDIRPIFSDVCFACHGPDERQRKGDLRLDKEEGIRPTGVGQQGTASSPVSVVVPGKPDDSELYRRVAAADPELRMPPVDHTRQLSPRQIALIRRWIEQGAAWQSHWSLIPPQRPEPPKFAEGSPQAAWIHNPIDAFILQRLASDGLQPSPDADRTTLIRRITLDLTGLPPTPEEVDAFLADGSGKAWENVVDRLLDSPRYGERMATRWLDAARYADTSGYQSDGERYMWRWRDWVIDAFNHNMPFDQFTVEQLAGDLLPQPTLPQKIATGFNRNLRGNAEGGIVPEEYLVEYTVDRVETTSTVWLGLTLGCTRCHDHKYDPFTQREFYQLFAYFNNVPERGRASKYGNSPPYIKAPTAAQQAELERLNERLKFYELHFAGQKFKLAEAQTAWEQSPDKKINDDWSITRDLTAHFKLDGDTQNSVVSSATDKDDAPAQSAIGNPQSAIPFSSGRLNQAASFNGETFINAGDLAGFGWLDKFTCAAWVRPVAGQGGTIVSRMTDAEQGDGWHVTLVNDRVQVHLAKRYLDDALRVETTEPLPANRWSHIAVAYDGSRVAAGVKVFIDGQPVAMTTLLDELNQTFLAKDEPFRIGGGNGPNGRFNGYIDDVRVYRDALTTEEIDVLAESVAISKLVAVTADKLTPSETRKLAAYFLAEHAPAAVKDSWQRVLSLRRELRAFEDQLPTTMVMEEMSPPRDTFILLRGEYDKHGERVTGGTPATLPPLAEGLPNNRLGFARWLVDPAHPLTARVAVNRYWQMYFGTGLVKTVDDFGSQGEWPTHPELLDWLATEFIRTGWDVKAMQKLIVMSHTYQQSSKVTPEKLQRDPDNRLLARGPRQRLSAEMVRDQALAAAGLLVEKVGGPSVKPYQPAGLWKELTGAEDYVADSGESLYRRSLYTFWKRTVAPPTMLTFDASGREACSVRETRTNTPLQALTLLNETTFVEAARMLAQRAMLHGGATPADRLTLAFRLATARRPGPAELQILTAGFDKHLARYQQAPDASAKLLATGESPRDPSLDPSELAAYTAVCSLILNLDEVITKQ